YGRINAAKETLLTLPSPEFFARPEWHPDADPAAMTPALRALARAHHEHCAHRALLETLELHGRWAEVRAGMVGSPDGAAHERREYSDWCQTMKDVTNEAVSRSQELLNAGWLETSADDSKDDPKRAAEVHLLRVMYVPEIVTWMAHMLIHTHQFAPENLARCVQLVDYVASPLSKLWREFREAGKLAAFAKQMGTATLAMLEGPKGRWAWAGGKGV
ncbi:hypothetical protein BDK51DRAFT_40065, partial [Blyttiomyces helicus]